MAGLRRLVEKRVKLYTYFRSSAAYRVRIALNLKGLAHEAEFVNLTEGEQRAPAYRALSAQGLVPTLEDDGNVLVQSLAIIEYLEERQPEPPLLPRDAAGRARVRALALAIACDIHPLNNLRVLQYLEHTIGLDRDRRLAWYSHWIAEGFAAFEQMLDHPDTGVFCHSDTPTLADIALVPQVANAVRFGCELAPYARVRRINEACLALPAFAKAAPANQPDAETVEG
jgi:maleylacetoacetate isomerase